MIKRKRLSPTSKILLSFLAISFIGCFLLCLPFAHNNGQWGNFVDGLFTSISGVCVTGLSVFDISLELTLFGKIVMLLLIQIGGLGFITINSLLFLLLGKKITFEKRLTIKEAFNQETVQGMVKLVKKILIFVFIVELAGAVCFLPTFVTMYGFWDGLFKSVFMSVSSFCNAGFDVLGNGVNAFQSLSAFATNAAVLVPAMLLTLLGGIGFITIYEVPKLFKKQRMSLHAKVTLMLTFLFVVGGAAVFAVLEWNNSLTIGNLSTGDKIVNSLFLSITPRTVGFSSVNLQNLKSGSIALTVVLMFIGGGSASTAGGIKVTTLFLILMVIFKKLRANGNIVFRKQQIGFRTIKKAVKIFNLYIFLTAVATILICCFENVTFTESLFETVSALSTVGLSLGITSLLGVVGKVVLMVLMLVGRVGIITMSIVILRNEDEIAETQIEYMEAKFLVG